MLNGIIKLNKYNPLHFYFFPGMAITLCEFNKTAHLFIHSVLYSKFNGYFKLIPITPKEMCVEL